MRCKLVEKVWKLKYIHEHGLAKKNFQKYTNIKNHICMPLHGNGLNVFQFGIV
jgi:hypothetical protein